MTLLSHAGHFTASDVGLFLGVFGGIVALLIIAIIAIFAAAIITLYKAKARVEEKLKEGKDSESKIYEEIDPMPQRKTSMDTADNVAYTSCHSIIQLASYKHQVT